MIERTILTAIFVRPFRCAECGARFFRWSLRKKPPLRESQAENQQPAEASEGERQDLLARETSRLNLKLSS
jgi:hypothetical protein